VNTFYKLGRLAALRKLGERVGVIHEGEDGYETYQRQAAKQDSLRPLPADTHGIWDHFDQRIQNPAEITVDSRYLSP